MAFGTDFLPTPRYWDAFKTFLKLKCGTPTDKDYLKKVKLYLDFASEAYYILRCEKFTHEEIEIWSRNAMQWDGWGKVYDSPKEMIELIEAWADEVEEKEKAGY